MRIPLGFGFCLGIFGISFDGIHQFRVKERLIKRYIGAVLLLCFFDFLIHGIFDTAHLPDLDEDLFRERDGQSFSASIFRTAGVAKDLYFAYGPSLCCSISWLT